jgi:uncharacterized protein YfbU (UPF0304 family)
MAWGVRQLQWGPVAQRPRPAASPGWKTTVDWFDFQKCLTLNTVFKQINSKMLKFTCFDSNKNSKYLGYHYAMFQMKKSDKYAHLTSTRQKCDKYSSKV